MSKYAEQAGKRLAGVLHLGESLDVAAIIKGPATSRGPANATSGYQKELGLDPYKDLAYDKHISEGYLGITDTRLILAKSPLWGSCKPKHVVADISLEDCELAWYDWDQFMGTDRVIHLRWPQDQFAGLFVPVTIRTFLSDSDREALVRQAEAIVAAFGDRATRVEPKPEWLK